MFGSYSSLSNISSVLLHCPKSNFPFAKHLKQYELKIIFKSDIKLCKLKDPMEISNS